MNGQYEWTEQGKELILHFQSLINQNGGRDITIRKIIEEAPEFFNGPKKYFPPYGAGSHKRPYELHEDVYIVTHWYTMRLIDIGFYLDRTEISVSNRAKLLGLGIRKKFVAEKREKRKPAKCKLLKQANKI